MREKLKTVTGQAAYAWRKAIVVPVVGQIEEVRGFCCFSFSRRAKGTAKRDVIASTHNLLEPCQAQRCPLAVV